MTKKQTQAIAIAEDVIAQLDARKFRATSGTYVVLPFEPVEGDLQSQLKKRIKNKPCKVCALGAMFLSKILKYNNFDIKSAVTWWSDDALTDVNDRSIMVDELSDIFDLGTLDLIEDFFEDFSNNAFPLLFGSKVNLKPEARLRAMMAEVIRQKGRLNFSTWESYLQNKLISFLDATSL